MKVFLDEISIWVHGLVKADHPPKHEWALSSLSRAWIQQKAESWDIYSHVILSHVNSSPFISPHFSGPWMGIYLYCRPLVLQPLRLDRMTLPTGLPVPPVLQWWVMERLSPHDCVGQVLVSGCVSTGIQMRTGHHKGSNVLYVGGGKTGLKFRNPMS